MATESPTHATIWAADEIGLRDRRTRRPVWVIVETFSLAGMERMSAQDSLACIETAFARLRASAPRGRSYQLVWHRWPPAGAPPE